MTTTSYTHGTYTGYYWHKCRCSKCTEYQRTRVARNRADRLASGRLSHGTRSAYDAGCRCEPCLAVRVDADRDYYARTGKR